MYCTWTSRDRSQRPLVVTKLPLPLSPAWKSPISNGWETLGSCHSSLCYYVNLDILTLGCYEIEVWWSLIDSNESWEGLSECPSGRHQKYVSRATSSCYNESNLFQARFICISSNLDSKSPQYSVFVAQKMVIARQRPDLDLIESQK